MPVLQSHPPDNMKIEFVYSANIFRTNSCPWSRLTAAEQKKKKRKYACGNNFYRSQQHRSVTLGPRKACHNTYEKVINSCGGVDIVLESSSAGYRHSRQFAYFPVYPGLYPWRPIEAIELPSESYLPPVSSYIALLMSSKARRQLPEALFHSPPPLPCPQPHPAAPALRAPALSSAVGAAAASRGGKRGDYGS